MKDTASKLLSIVYSEQLFSDLIDISIKRLFVLQILNKQKPRFQKTVEINIEALKFLGLEINNKINNSNKYNLILNDNLLNHYNSYIKQNSGKLINDLQKNADDLLFSRFHDYLLEIKPEYSHGEFIS